MQTWKVPHLVKGALSYVPAVNLWRARRRATGGSSSSRYCYAVWLRHLVLVSRYGFRVAGSTICELGPGDTIGTGLAALLAGARRYIALDAVPYSAKADLTRMIAELAQMYAAQEPIPTHEEFPRVRPRLSAYEFPARFINTASLHERIEAVTAAIASGVPTASDLIVYHAPWRSVRELPASSLDLIFSQAALQYVDALEDAYTSMFTWLKPGGYASHATGLGANDLSPFWNGHWAYSDREWQVVRGRREYLLNREPLSTHLRLAAAAGFDVLHVEPQYDRGGLSRDVLAERFRHLDSTDLAVRGAVLILRKPAGS
jgi:SAM-dependent methyltransferase